MALMNQTGSQMALFELIKAGFDVSVPSRWALGAYFEAGSLVAVKASRQGLDITWKTIIKAAAEEYAPERKVAMLWRTGSGTGVRRMQQRETKRSISQTVSSPDRNRARAPAVDLSMYSGLPISSKPDTA